MKISQEDAILIF